MRVILFLLLYIISLRLTGQDTWYVYFIPEKDTAFQPFEYFHSAAIERRWRQGIPLCTFSDLPVKEKFLQGIEPDIDTLLGVSRWLNMAIVSASDEGVERLKQRYYVQSIVKIQANEAMVCEDPYADLSEMDSALLTYQTMRLQGNIFDSLALHGEGIRIAVFDVGFYGADEHPAFHHLRLHNRIVMTRNFVNEKKSVYMPGSHGTTVLSCIAGIYRDEVSIGLATEAEFLLAKTERALSEFKSEEYNWLLAAEWADKNGADIINSSLGYTSQRYFPEDMNGEVSLSSRAATLAAEKGILVVNAAGNEGSTGRWIIVCAPADAPKVLSVGATDPLTDVGIYFSSHGPTWDSIPKPNVSAPGHVFAANAFGHSQTFGTSFAAPLVAGFAACLWQHNRNLTNFELMERLEKAGHLYPYFDYIHGYGVPQASLALQGGRKQVDTTFRWTMDSTGVSIAFDTTLFNSEDTIRSGANDSLPANRLPIDLYDCKMDDGSYGPYNLYYHLSNDQGWVIRYGVARITHENPVRIRSEWLSGGYKLMIHFEGYTNEILIEDL